MMNEKQKKKMETKARLLKRLADYVERKKAMNQEQTDKLRVLEWVFDHKYPATLKDKIEAAKEIHKFIFGEEQAVPEVESEVTTGKGSDTRVDYVKPISKTLVDAINFNIPTKLSVAYNTDGSIKTLCELEKYRCPACDNIFFVDSEIKSNDYYCPACGK